MKPQRVTVVGAGLAGLSAAVALVRAGIPVAVAEAASRAGGRCRSYHDPQLGLTIDNGNHLVLSGNQAVARFRAAVGATPPLAGPDEAAFAFRDLTDGKSWTVRINAGPIPWWTLSPGRRVPGSRLGEYLSLAHLFMARDGRIDAHVATGGAVWTRFVEPVLLAALNTAPAEASARLAANLFRETLVKGGSAMHPRIAEPTLAAAFIDPAVDWLAAERQRVTFNRRLQGIGFQGDRIVSLDWGQGPEAVGGAEAVILAVPPWAATALVPGLEAPDAFRAIVNAHFAIPAPAGAPAMLGLIGGTAEWLFAFPDRISVTVSAADRLVDIDREALARQFWADILLAYGIDAPMPRWQIVKEKRATFAATPEQEARRPPAATRWRNLFLAGDWTATGLPATIEGALGSGETAARLAAGAALG